MQFQFTFLCSICILTLYSVCCDAEIEFFPDLRKVQELKWINDEDVDTGYPSRDYALQRFPVYLKERARLYHQNHNNQQDNRPPFYYRFPDQPPAINSKSSRPFAVDPSNPKYYLKTPIIPDYNSDITNSKIEDDENEDELIDDIRNNQDDNDESSDEIISQNSINNNKGTPAVLQQQITSTTNTHQRKLYNGDFVRGGDTNGVRIVPATIDVDREKEAVGLYVIAIVAGISAAATVGLIVFGFGYYNLQKNAKAAADVEYPAYGVTGPHKDVSPSGDRRLAQSAHMYHYQHQKQQIIAMERAANERHGSMSEADTDEENEEGDYTVYECPGLAPTGEMEVKNPLFQDDPTPATGPANEKSPAPIGGTPDLK